ncbi:glycosyltransferase family 2 protein [Oscillatoria sp. FACHB-1406]|uniref:glycosyltransferase family 2 protein n=1 Tax=Oscillatoria sp. FACHB-1406 TaxID=2692846 RepID=UPI0016851C94|nr:glycosyltransferase family 2 protein [Oscillatoria sp. FACHB-1406]MBD2578283.1 glycosyltransferase family 2 protein [Oscillatoria sp. FACHB-1406]
MNCARLAVLLTCYNRKSKTLDCLQRLFNQDFTSEVSLDVYLVDDGSTDGTADAIRQTYPQVKIFSGTGSLFWNGGMRYAFEEALKGDYDYYVWLNDDTMLYPNALAALLETSAQLAAKGEDKAIVAGSTQDPDTQEFTYGGIKQHGPLFPPFKVRSIEPTDTPQKCDAMCGNIVLIPRSVVQRVGNLDPQLTHYAGDWDYGLRAKQEGCTVWIAPGYQGTCPRNPTPEPGSVPKLEEGLKKMGQPKGLALQDVTLQSFDEWKIIMKRHGGLLWPIFWLLPYRRLLPTMLFRNPKKA